MDWRGCGNPADQASRWEYVSLFPVGADHHRDLTLVSPSSSFAQSVCVIGYTLFPLVIASFFSAFGLIWVARIPIYTFLVAWSLAAGVSILSGSGVVQNRVGLAVYPLFVFYSGIGCLCFIS